MKPLILSPKIMSEASKIKRLYKQMPPQRKLERFNKLFWSHVIKEESGCWHWTGCIRSERIPYGKAAFRWNGIKMQLAHRVAWFLTTGDLAVGKCILHRCDNHRCVNPAHLFKGTQTENVADAAAKGRMRGVPNNRHSAKLNLRQAEAIRKAVGKQDDIAKRFGVSQGAVSLIKLGKTWREKQ